MAMSGVKVEDRVQDEFREMKHGKQLNRFIQMHIDKGEICIEKCAAKSDTPRGYEEFVEQLPADDCRYAFVDFHYEDPEKGPQDKLVFVNWCPDTAKVGKKMLYASSKDAIKNKVGGGIAAEIQACDFDEVSPEAVLDKLKTKK